MALRDWPILPPQLKSQTLAYILCCHAGQGKVYANVLLTSICVCVYLPALATIMLCQSLSTGPYKYTSQRRHAKKKMIDRSEKPSFSSGHIKILSFSDFIFTTIIKMKTKIQSLVVFLRIHNQVFPPKSYHRMKNYNVIESPFSLELSPSSSGHLVYVSTPL